MPGRSCGNGHGVHAGPQIAIARIEEEPQLAVAERDPNLPVVAGRGRLDGGNGRLIEQADLAIAEKLAAIDEATEPVIRQSRERSDEMIAAARANRDRRAATPQSGAQIEQQRLGEDESQRRERAAEDQELNQERAASLALFSQERREIDQSLILERTKADEALTIRDQFLGIVSHDLRNLLNAVVLFATLIEKIVEEEDHTAPVRKYAQGIRRLGGRMNRLIGDLIDIVRIEAGGRALRREPGDPTPVLSEVVETWKAQAAARNLSLSAAIRAPLGRAAFDPARLLQVLINRLSNAIKFTPAPGKIVVCVERRGAEIRFSVRYTGPGIPADKLGLIFERYLQITPEDQRGMRLGLYIAKCIVLGHGGRIWAESKVGVGSTFYFTLPSHP